jgi:hypothetical protein
MVYRTRINYTPAQKAEIWNRWKRGESMSSIVRAFGRASSSMFSLLSPLAEFAHHHENALVNSGYRSF